MTVGIHISSTPSHVYGWQNVVILTENSSNASLRRFFLAPTLNPSVRKLYVDNLFLNQEKKSEYVAYLYVLETTQIAFQVNTKTTTTTTTTSKNKQKTIHIHYNPFFVYRRELAPGTVSLTGDQAQGDDSKHDSHYTWISNAL